MKTICDKLVTFLMSPRRWKKTSEQQQPQGEDHQLAKEDQEDCYPNCDISIWLRNCGSETIEPIKGISFGSIPDWISGCLYRNGPGKQRYDRQSVNHLFDASGLLHKFKIKDGQVTYQSRYVKSKAYERNMAAQQVVVAEFTTQAAPDPCKTIFHKFLSLFVLDEVVSDNAMISIYPLGDGELYAFAETPFIHRIDRVSLETTGRTNLHDTIGLMNQSSHPHSFNGEGTYNLGQVMGPMGPNYAIVHYPMTPSSVKDGRIVARVPCYAPTEPSYMHSFSVTANYFVLAEQSLHVRLKNVIALMLQSKPLVHSLKWRQTMTRFRLIDRKTGKEFPAIEYVTDAFFFLHTVNAFETEDGRHLVVDICCYNDARMLDCMYIEALQSAQSEPNYASLFRGRPKRFVLPLKPERGYSGDLNESCNLSASEAYWLHPCGSNDDNVIVIRPDELCHLGCETPTVNYATYNGRPYRYFYAISSDVDADNPGTLIKVDTAEKTCLTWAEKNVYASEPIFIPRPNANAEDDGVIISSLIWGGEGNDKRVGCLVLDAATWTELGRTEFVTEDQVPKCLHGCYVPSN